MLTSVAVYEEAPRKRLPVSPVERLLESLSDTAGVYVPPGEDEATYFADLAQDIRDNMCEPFEVSAVVMPPGFPNVAVGSFISGECVARRDGYWLVYSPEIDTFFCLWGEDEEHLGARGIFGSPLYCWSA